MATTVKIYPYYDQYNELAKSHPSNTANWHMDSVLTSYLYLTLGGSSTSSGMSYFGFNFTPNQQINITKVSAYSVSKSGSTFEINNGISFYMFKNGYGSTQGRYQPYSSYDYTTHFEEWSVHPLTGESFTVADFSDTYFGFAISTDYEISVHEFYLEITYEVVTTTEPIPITDTPIGYVKFSNDTGIIALPVFELTKSFTYKSYLRISLANSKIGAFELVSLTDAKASPIRISTPSGILAIKQT